MVTETITSPWGPVEIQRKNRRQRLAVILNPHKGIQVRTNKKTPLHQIESFLQLKQGWIEKNLRLFADLQEKFPRRVFRPGATVPLLGVEKPLEFLETSERKWTAELGEKKIFIHVPQLFAKALADGEDRPEVRSLLRGFYQDLAKKFLYPRVKYWAHLMDVDFRNFGLTQSKRLWGSCSPKRDLLFNWKILVFEIEVIDYLIVHELAHLTHMNHSRDFWQRVELYYPQFRSCRQILKQQASRADFLNKDY